MLACERTEYDLLSLGVQGHELEVSKEKRRERESRDLHACECALPHAGLF